MGSLLIILAFLGVLLSPAIWKAVSSIRQLRAIRKINVQGVWDGRSDAEILASFKDAMGWIDISKGYFKSETTESIAKDCQTRLDKYIMPQIEKRGLVHE